MECYYCQEKGHIATFCPKKKRESEQQSNVNARVSDESQENKCVETSNVSFSFAQQKLISRDWLLLDNQSSVHIFCNKNLLEDIHETTDKLVLMTNGGVLTTKMKGRAKGIGWVWFHPKAITNILSLGLLEEMYRITYDSVKEKSFVVHKSELDHVKFKKNSNGLYIIDLSKRTGKEYSWLTR